MSLFFRAARVVSSLSGNRPFGRQGNCADSAGDSNRF